MKYIYKRFLILFASFLSVLSYSGSLVAAERVYTIARGPQLSVSETNKAWSPYIQYLNESTGYKFKLKLYNNRDLFEQDIKKAKVDFYYGNPGYGIVGHLNHGYLPVLTDGKKKLQGIIVARKDGDIKRVSDLSDKTLVFPGKTAFAASLLIKYHMGQQYDINFDEAYVVGHDNVYRNVLNGNYDAGGGVYKTLNREHEGLRNQLQVIYETPLVSSHPLMVHPAVPELVKNEVIRKTMELEHEDQGKKILKKIKLTRPVVPDYEKDYKSLEPLIKTVYRFMLID